jgi:hypothetical protein
MGRWLTMADDLPFSEPTGTGPPAYVQRAGEIDTDVSLLRFRAKAFTRLWVSGPCSSPRGRSRGSISFPDGRVSGVGEIAADRLSAGLAPRDWRLHSCYLYRARHPRIRVAVAQTPVAGPFECTLAVRGASCTAPCPRGRGRWTYSAWVAPSARSAPLGMLPLAISVEWFARSAPVHRYC